MLSESSSSDAFLLFRAIFLLFSFILKCSAKSFLSYLFIEEASSSIPLSVVFTGFSFSLLFLIYAIKSDLDEDFASESYILFSLSCGGGGGGGISIFSFFRSTSSTEELSDGHYSVVSSFISYRCFSFMSYGCYSAVFFAW